MLFRSIRQTCLHTTLGLYGSSKKGIITTFVYIVGLLVTLWIYSRHLPLGDLYESCIFLLWSLSIIHMVTYLKKHKNHLSAIIAPMLKTVYAQNSEQFL